MVCEDFFAFSFRFACSKISPRNRSIFALFFGVGTFSTLGGRLVLWSLRWHTGGSGELLAVLRSVFWERFTLVRSAVCIKLAVISVVLWSLR
jgi:hypothetical protein